MARGKRGSVDNCAYSSVPSFSLSFVFPFRSLSLSQSLSLSPSILSYLVRDAQKLEFLSLFSHYFDSDVYFLEIMLIFNEKFKFSQNPSAAKKNPIQNTVSILNM